MFFSVQVMRRDKTLKLCANHFINPHMKLKPNASCERAWVYSVEDFSNATVKTEMLAIKFANIESKEVVVIIKSENHFSVLLFSLLHFQ